MVNLWVLLIMISTVPPRIAESLEVAVLGSGVAGSTAARLLADAGVRVTVFECGRGLGGRTSTRTSREGGRYVFDHGAQYISGPKTEPFGKALADWRTAGFVREWDGRFADAVAGPAPGGAAFVPVSPEKSHLVGYPAMNSISRNLLHHKNIRVKLQTRACASLDGEGRWALTSHGDRKALGAFDWLVGSDRLSGTNNRADLRDAPLSSFKSHVESIISVPTLVLMVVFASSLPLPLDGIRFDEKSGEFGSLGWAARDTSKPGRERDDGRECWVIQSGPQAAKEIIESVDGTSFEDAREQVRERAKELLLVDFLAALPKLVGDDLELPEVVSAVGHRWSAAFPVVPPSADTEREEHVSDFEKKFVACGDYVGDLHGRIEGAYLSGRAAAGTILDVIGGGELE